MEVIGITRGAEGSESEEFVVRCEIHNWYFKGLPPINIGCRECWHCYYFAQIALSHGDKYTNFLQLEQAINHVKEDVEAGKWDVELYPHPQVSIEKEN